MAGALSPWRMECAEGEPPRRTPAETERRHAEMALQYSDTEEPAATEVPVRSMDPRDGGGVDRAKVWHSSLLAQLGITAQKPLYRAMERDETLVHKWLKTEYPMIKKMAKAQGADIYFGDAAHIRSDHHAGRTWGKQGETPVVTTTGARHAMSLISAITSKGRMRFMVKPT